MRQEDNLDIQKAKALGNLNDDIDIQKMALPYKKTFVAGLSGQVGESVKNPSHTMQPQQNYISCFHYVQNPQNSLLPSKAPLPSSQINTINFIPVSLNSSNIENNSVIPTYLQNAIPMNHNIMQPQSQAIYTPYQFPVNNNGFSMSYQCPQSQPTYILLNNASNSPIIPVNSSIQLANTLNPLTLNQNTGHGFIQGQVLPQNNPVVILLDKSMLIPNQNLPIMNSFPIRQVEQRQQIPVQIQYHTNIYCPNSNNNLFTLDPMGVKNP